VAVAESAPQADLTYSYNSRPVFHLILSVVRYQLCILFVYCF